jgi:serine/threonine-protein kinase
MKKIEIPGHIVESKIAEGAFSTVYKAVQISLDRTVTLKVLKPSLTTTPSAVAKFRLESNAAMGLRHGNIIQSYEANEFNGVYYATYEFITGNSLANLLKHKTHIPESGALSLIETLAEALEYAWLHGENIHANLKPRNILIDTDGILKLADFSGLTHKTSVTLLKALSGTRIGDPAYSAPELAGEPDDIDFRADIYSLGALLYHLLTSKKPFTNLSDSQRLSAHRDGHLINPRDIDISCSISAAQLVRKMMIKAPEGRHKDWQELLNDISLARNNLLQNVRLPPNHSSTVQEHTFQFQYGKRQKVLRYKIMKITFYILLTLFAIANIWLLIKIFIY